jgi:quinol-cytochrome oxidoreductase complex cytochrome b subunit
VKAGRLSTVLDMPVLARKSFLTDVGRVGVFLFGVEVVTGSLLALYYRPAPEAAFESVQFVSNDVTFGWLVRSVHLAAGHAIVVLAAALVLRAFLRRTFLERRGAASWLVTVAFFLSMLAFFFTGEALPWDQVAYWRTVVTANLVDATPVVGPWIAGVLRGGTDVTGLTLVRLYAAHALVLPWVTFWLILRMRNLLRAGAKQ